MAYLVKIRLEDTRSEDDTQYYVEDTFNITIRDDCSQDVLTLNSYISAKQLIIDNGNTAVSLSLSQSVAGCTLSRGIEYFDEDTRVWVDASSEAWV